MNASKLNSHFGCSVRRTIDGPVILPVPFPPGSNQAQQMVTFTASLQSTEEGADSAIMHRNPHLTPRTAAGAEPNKSPIH